MSKIEELEKAKKEMDLQLEILRRPELHYTQLEDIVIGDKIAFFDTMYRRAETHLKQRAAEGSEAVSDDVHYFFEEVMEGTLGKDIFKLYNQLKD